MQIEELFKFKEIKGKENFITVNVILLSPKLLILEFLNSFQIDKQEV
jgi:hypothetical protein